MASGTIEVVRGMNNIVRLTSTQDLDNIIVPGLYFWDNSAPTNAPANYCSLIVNKATNSAVAYQLCWGSTYLFYRTYSPSQSKWNNWRRVSGTEITS